MSKSAISNLAICAYTHVVLVSPVESLPVPNTTSDSSVYNESIISWGDFIKRGHNVHSETVPYKTNMPFAILHTGGTTGIPKGALLSHDNFNSLSFQVNHSPLGMHSGETVLNLMPPFSSYGIGYGIHVHMCAGMRVRLIPTYDPSIADKQLLKYHIDLEINMKKLKMVKLN